MDLKSSPIVVHAETENPSLTNKISDSISCIETNEKENCQRESNPVVTNELAVKHPLQCRWALWYLKGDRSKDWEDCLKCVSVFDTVEDFWSLYNNIQPASGLSWGSDYYLFKEGIKPMWEDPNNVNGGRWLVIVDKHKRALKLDNYWLELMMAIVGEQFDDFGNHICGAVVNVRQKGDKVALWTRDATQDDMNLRIGQTMKSKLEIPDAEPIRYEVHKDSSARTGSVVKPKIVIPSKEANNSSRNTQN